MEATRNCQVAADAAQGGGELEDKADVLIHELARIEQQALGQPAPDVVALRFKLSLWANSRVEGYEDEWRILARDCERFLPER